MAFSTFVLRALSDLPAADAVAAMRAINRRAISPVFLTVLMGPALLSLVLLVAVVVGAPDASALGAAGAVLYLVGVFGVTVAANVPRNDALERSEAGDAAVDWARYQRGWGRWNHVRVLLGSTASVLFALAFASHA